MDSTGLYYYGARYYDPSIGRFISPDTIVHNISLPAGKIIQPLVVSYSQQALRGEEIRSLYRQVANPQELNRYSYVINNPLKYVDPTGHQTALEWSEDLESFGNGLPPNFGFWVKGVGILIGLGYSGWLWWSTHSADNSSSNRKVDNSGDAGNGDPNGLDKPPKGDFREKLKEYTGLTDEQIAGKDAHHIFPEKFRDEFWERWGIDIDDPQYGSWVDNYKSGVLKGQSHQDWSWMYNNQWEGFLAENPTREEVYEFGRLMMEDLGIVYY